MGQEAVIRQLAIDPAGSMLAHQPRAHGTARLSVVSDAPGQSRLGTLRQSGSMKLAFPRTAIDRIEAIMVNTAGGITGGDHFEVSARAEEGATLTLTTQAAERAYRAQRGETGILNVDLNVDGGASLLWLPQELILFDRCALHRRLDIDVAPGGSLLMVEPMVFGRTARAETLSDIRFRDRIRIRRGGQPIYIDGMDLNGDATAQLAHPTIAAGAGAQASLVLVSPEAEAHLGPVRASLPTTAGASLLSDDMLVLRLLAEDGLALRRHLLPILDRLTDNHLPTSWRL